VYAYSYEHCKGLWEWGRGAAVLLGSVGEPHNFDAALAPALGKVNITKGQLFLMISFYLNWYKIEWYE
jgi:hypothetical protein